MIRAIPRTPRAVIESRRKRIAFWALHTIALHESDRRRSAPYKATWGPLELFALANVVLGRAHERSRDEAEIIAHSVIVPRLARAPTGPEATGRRVRPILTFLLEQAMRDAERALPMHPDRDPLDTTEEREAFFAEVRAALPDLNVDSFHSLKSLIERGPVHSIQKLKRALKNTSDPAYRAWTSSKYAEAAETLVHNSVEYLDKILTVPPTDEDYLRLLVELVEL